MEVPITFLLNGFLLGDFSALEAWDKAEAWFDVGELLFFLGLR